MIWLIHAVLCLYCDSGGGVGGGIGCGARRGALKGGGNGGEFLER